MDYNRPRLTFASALFVLLAAGSLHGAPEQQPNPREYAIYAPRPRLSYEAVRDRGASGDGMFELRLRPDGTVAAVAVFRSTGHKMVDREVAATFARWRFHPGTRKTIRIPFSFKREW